MAGQSGVSIWTIYAKSTEDKRLSWNQNPANCGQKLMGKIVHWDNPMARWCSPTASENDYAIKPDELPFVSVQVFNQGLKSYRDLPLTAYWVWLCHRNELSGFFAWPSCVCVAFTQDDAHIFAPRPTRQEALNFIKLTPWCVWRLWIWPHSNEAVHSPRKRVGRTSCGTWQNEP